MRFQRLRSEMMQISRKRFLFANMFFKFADIEDVIESRIKKFAAEIPFYKSCILFLSAFLIFVVSIKYFRFVKKKFENIISFSRLDLNELEKNFLQKLFSKIFRNDRR